MSEAADPRDERNTQLVDEPAVTTDEQVSDRDYDGSPDFVAAGTDDGDIADATSGSVDRATTEDTGDERDELLPGEAAVAPVGALWSSASISGLQDRWQQLQLRFVDDPRGVLAEAQSLVAEAVQGFTSALTGQQRELDGWASGGAGDTEQLRVALQRYRDFFDRLVSQA
jgi:hypothetical protein